MKYLESKKVIHCDLALRNLLVREDEQSFIVKVSDFGLSTSLAQMDETSQKFTYMSSKDDNEILDLFSCKNVFKLPNFINSIAR